MTPQLVTGALQHVGDRHELGLAARDRIDPPFDRHSERAVFFSLACFEINLALLAHGELVA